MSAVATGTRPGQAKVNVPWPVSQILASTMRVQCATSAEVRNFAALDGTPGRPS
jgi:hypothetical protein